MTEAPAPRSLRRHQAITLSLLFLAGIVNFLDRSLLSIANTTVRAEMHLNATQMGWLLSAFSFAYGFAQLPLIGLLDRVGTRYVLGGGLTLWSAAQMLTGLVRGLPIFLLLRVLLGIGEAPFYPSGIRSTREWFSSATRGRATAVMSSSSTIGLAFAPPVLTWIPPLRSFGPPVGMTELWGWVCWGCSSLRLTSLGALQNFASFMIASAAPVVTGWLLDRTHSFTIALGLCSAVTLLGALSYATLAAPSGMHLEREAT